jgi:hypothetical protein
MDRTFCHRLTLRPLAGEAVAGLVGERLKLNPELLKHREAIARRASGNPFFAEELVREMAARGPESPLTDLPDSVRGVVEARIDRLSETERDFLQAAAVVGRDFDVELVREVADLSIDSASDATRRLIEAEMLYERASLARALAFKHPLVQEVAYNVMLRRNRGELHRRCANALSRTTGNDASKAALTAYHWERSGDSSQAAANYAKAALWAAPRAPAHAVESWRAVRRVLAGQPAAAQADYMRMMAGGQIVNLAWREGLEEAEVSAAFEESLAIAKRLGDGRALVLIRLAYGRFLAARGSADDYLAQTELTIEDARVANDASVDALALAVHSHALSMTGFVRRGLEANAGALAVVDKISARDLQTLGYDVRHWLIALRARMLLLANHPDEARPQLDQLLRAPAQKVDALHRTMAWAVAAELSALEHRTDEVHACAAEIEAAARESPTPYLRVLALRFRGAAALAAGEHDLATDLLTQGLALIRRSRAGLEFEPQILVGLSEAALSKDAEAARTLREEALTVARRRGMRASEILALAAWVRAEPKDGELPVLLRQLSEETGVTYMFRAD